MKKSKKGFTLVELLAIIAIITILIIIIAPKITQIFKNAQRETFMSQVRGMVKSSNLEIIDETGVTFDCNKYLDDQKYKDCTGTLDDGISISALGDGEYSNLLAVDVTEDPKSGTIIDLDELNKIKIPKQDIINESLIKNNAINPFFRRMSGEEVVNLALSVLGDKIKDTVPEEEMDAFNQYINTYKKIIDDMSNNNIIEDNYLTQKEMMTFTDEDSGESEPREINVLFFELNFTKEMLGTYTVTDFDFEEAIMIAESELKYIYNNDDDDEIEGEPEDYISGTIEPDYEFTIKSPEKVYLIVPTLYEDEYNGLTIERNSAGNSLQLIGGTDINIHINDVKNYVDEGIKNAGEKLTEEGDFYSYTNLREREGDFVYNYVVKTDKGIKIFKRKISVYDDTPTSCFEFKYNENRDSYEITDYYDTEDDSPDAESCPSKVYIPDKYNGKNIDYIGYGAFEYKNITSVRLPINLLAIDSYAFDGNELTYVELPKNLEDMNYRVFRNNNIKYIKYTGRKGFCNQSIGGQKYNFYSDKYIGGTSWKFLYMCMG